VLGQGHVTYLNVKFCRQIEDKGY